MTMDRELSEFQERLINRWYLGGVDAIGTHSTQTVRSLIDKGYLDSKGLTDKARAYCKQFGPDMPV